MDSDPFSLFEFVSPFVDVDASADVKYEQSITFLAHVRYYHRLLYVFFLLSSEQKTENEFVTHSIRYSHHHHWLNANR